jgi:hypothetical protein
MALDLLRGKISRDWSCGIASVPASQQKRPGSKSASELWDEAESARLRRPVKYMSDRGRPARLPPPAPQPEEVSVWKALLPAVVGSAVAGVVLIPLLRPNRR